MRSILALSRMSARKVGTTGAMSLCRSGRTPRELSRTYGTPISTTNGRNFSKVSGEATTEALKRFSCDA